MKRNHLFQSVCRTMRSLPMSVPAGAYSLILIAAMLTGCSKDHLQDGETLPDGKYPMAFTASVEGITTTRATGKDAWTSGDKVAIQIDAETAQEYSADATGKLSCTPPMYWQNTTETHTVNAWYPYASEKPTVTVKAGQSIAANYLASDLLEVNNVTLTFTNSNLTFTHRTAKVIVNLIAGADVTLDANTTVTFMSLTAVEGGATVVTPDKVDNTYTALLAPQNCSGRKFIKVTTDSRDYYYIPQTQEANFEAGNQYTYLVTVKKTGITVTVTGATAWGDSGTSIPVTGKTPKSGFFASDLKIGDFYYSDGTTSDGGYREYTNNTTATLPIIPVLKAADGTSRDVIGIVFKAGKDNSDQGDYKDRNGNTMSIIQGYVLALRDAAAAAAVAWVKENNESSSGIGTSRSENDWQGYSNCQTIKAYTQDNGCSIDNYDATNQCLIFGTGTNDSQYAAPSGSSGWFLPSAGQLSHIYTKKDLLSGQITKLKPTNTDAGWFGRNNSYWSSSESETYTTTDGYAYAYDVSFSSYSSVVTNTKSHYSPVRSILVF